MIYFLGMILFCVLIILVLQIWSYSNIDKFTKVIRRKLYEPNGLKMNISASYDNLKWYTPWNQDFEGMIVYD